MLHFWFLCNNRNWTATLKFHFNSNFAWTNISVKNMAKSDATASNSPDKYYYIFPSRSTAQQTGITTKTNDIHSAQKTKWNGKASIDHSSRKDTNMVYIRMQSALTHTHACFARQVKQQNIVVGSRSAHKSALKSRNSNKLITRSNLNAQCKWPSETDRRNDGIAAA